MKTIYTAQVISHGGRDGSVRSSDGLLELQVRQPKEGQKEGTNPEQLFGAGYAACFHSALKSVAKSKKLESDGSEVTANVSLHQEGDNYQLSVRLDIRIPGMDEGQIMELAEAAHRTCPYSKATRDNIEVKLNAVAEQVQR